MSPDSRRSIPQVEVLVRTAASASALPRPLIVDAVRTVTAELRKRLRRGQPVPTLAQIHAMVASEVKRREEQGLQRVINASGVIVHTNLGRAPLPKAALDAIMHVASGYTNLEFDLATGRRGDRHEHAEPALAVATGAQAALVVNNGAAAVLLMCAALGAGKQIVVSRGELVEIGGSFRIPDVISQSGATLREVGTTNRTHLRDYEAALKDDGIAAVLKVHPSNYRVIGFTNSVDTHALARASRSAGVPLLCDAGSGLLTAGMGDEPVIADLLSAGADVVTFSGDKLLGGPQAGIIVGRRTLIERMKLHPLMRALRPDKMTLAALSATIALHLEDKLDEIPVWRMLNSPTADLQARCAKLGKALTRSGFKHTTVNTDSVAGGGSMPEAGIQSPVLRLTHGDLTPTQLSAALRGGRPPLVVRVAGRAVLVDLRTVEPSDDDLVAAALKRAAASKP